ncbi:MAG: hypothetical protein LLG40_13965 [Deltaproteobacteria bacterium]|nr:hypothetical protein [Deltaproteobacteria bacterium]
MKQLFLEDLKEMTDQDVRKHIVSRYEVIEEIVDKYKILIAYESVGNWGCDSASFFLLRNKKSKALFTVTGSHCSCYGFEGQFEPEKVTLDYLKSDKFYFCCGGYDGSESSNKQEVKYFIDHLRI